MSNVVAFNRSSSDWANTASMQLGYAAALAKFCCTRVSDSDLQEDRLTCEWESVAGTLLHIEQLVCAVASGAHTASPAARQAIGSARAVSSLIVSEATTVRDGRQLQHFNDEITDFAFGALAHALEQAKQAIDDLPYPQAGAAASSASSITH